ncbi:MAG: hypothetical protein J6N51_08930 [Selenomonas sp.]|nr:hypothetical protein [Selenomonas sp.]
MVNAKKILASLMVGTFFAVAAPVGVSLDGATAYSVASAAKGGAKFSAPKPAPKPAQKSNAAPDTKASNSKSVSGNGKDYKPSKDAKSLEKDAPGTGAAAKNSPAAAAGTAASQSSSGWGSALRQVGILAGGMFLGHMLASLIGSGGIIGDVLGVVANIILFGAVIMLIRWAWNRFRGNRGASYSRNDSWQSRPSEPVDVTPRDSGNRPVYQDISRISSGEYEAKSMADRYRNR